MTLPKINPICLYYKIIDQRLSLRFINKKISYRLEIQRRHGMIQMQMMARCGLRSVMQRAPLRDFNMRN